MSTSTHGNRPDKSLEWVNMIMRRRLNMATPYLTSLLKDKQYIYNTVNYEDRDDYANTCGSRVVRKLYRPKKNGMDLHAYHDFMKSIKDEFGVDYDIIVAEFINKWF